MPEPFVDIENIADVAIGALTQPEHSGQIYELTGLTFAKATGKATRREIRYIPITAEQYRAALGEAQVPDVTIDPVLYLLHTVLDGRNTPLADGVQRALGRTPRDFAEYLKRAAATGAWEA